MPNLANPFQTLKQLPSGKYYYSLKALEEGEIADIKRLPVSIRIILESLLRNCDGLRVKEEDVIKLAKWNPHKPDEGDVPFIVSRVILQDFTGVPLLVDLAAMRDAVAKLGIDPLMIEPQVPVDLVIDHSVQVDRAGSSEAFQYNMKVELERNLERYEFLKWGQEAFETFKVVPPAIGIVHQVNLEHLATVVVSKEEEGKVLLYPDTLVGTDSHTTMINGLGVVGWGVGGIEAEAAMLGQPVSLQTPEVIGVHLSGQLKPGVTATDLTLRITEMLRKEKVVGKFVEFFGEGAASLNVADRATIGNMAPEYGATMGYFPPDQKTLDYLEMTARDKKQVAQVKEYLQAQGLFGMPRKGEIEYSKVLELDLNSVQPCVAGPKRPQDRIELSKAKDKFHELLYAPLTSGGYGKAKESVTPHVNIHSNGENLSEFAHDNGGTNKMPPKNSFSAWSEVEMVTNRPMIKVDSTPDFTHYKASETVLTHGSVVLAAITSCTNTSNPNVMLAAGLLAKKAVEKGLRVNPLIKTSLAPGSRVVTDYLEKTGLQRYLDQLGFHLVGYGCTTCIGNSGPLDERIEKAIKENDLVVASVLSGNRNFEARIHGDIKANFLMSPPLVVAFAIVGKIDVNLEHEALGYGKDNKPVFLRDIWPTEQEIQENLAYGLQPDMFKQRYAHILEDNLTWKEIKVTAGAQYSWGGTSTYIQQPPFFERFSLSPPPPQNLQGMRPLAIFGDSVTTDHISPAGAITVNSTAGEYLRSLDVRPEDFNSFGSRRGNHQVMMRGTFANVRIRNKMADGKEGGYTKLMPEGKLMSIYEAASIYESWEIPLIVFAGRDYGMGSSRDWAAKGPALLGVKVVVASSFERIHRSNLIGMGILPLEFVGEENAETLDLKGDEVFTLVGLEKSISPKQTVELDIIKGKKARKVSLRLRLDTPLEIEYYRHGGILPFMLRRIINSKKK